MNPAVSDMKRSFLLKRISWKILVKQAVYYVFISTFLLEIYGLVLTFKVKVKMSHTLEIELEWKALDLIKCQ